MSVVKLLTNNAINIPGWHTNRKIVVIESDDWGSIRMPSRDVYRFLLNSGIRVDKDPYCRYDALATKDDLVNLFDVLCSVKDKNGRNAVLTADTIVANPHFEKIRESDFAQYFYEPFVETLHKSGNHDGVFDLWKEGISNGIFIPQFHGREHLNVKKWMKALQSREMVTMEAFNCGCFGLTSLVDDRINNNYMGAFNSGLDADILEYEKILVEGLALFERLFGYQSTTFISTTYTWSPKIEPILKQNGVRCLQGMISQRIPLDDDVTFKYKNTNFMGYKSKSGLRYLMRNCFFEPTHYKNKQDVMDDCLNRCRIAFKWHKPAVISMHRVNVIGCIDRCNGEENLKLFQRLLKSIVTIWPDVEFMSSNELENVFI